MILTTASTAAISMVWAPTTSTTAPPRPPLRPLRRRHPPPLRIHSLPGPVLLRPPAHQDQRRRQLLQVHPFPHHKFRMTARDMSHLKFLRRLGLEITQKWREKIAKSNCRHVFYFVEKVKRKRMISKYVGYFDRCLYQNLPGTYLTKLHMYIFSYIIQWDRLVGCDLYHFRW